MKKGITAILLAILLIGAFGAAVVSAVASDDTGATYGPGFMHRWAARYTDSGYGNYAACPYYSADGTVELEVENIDEALEIAQDEIDEDITEDDIYQLNRWWIVSYEDEDGVYTQARIDAVTGEVYTGYDVPAGYQTGGRFGRGAGYARGFGYCMEYGN
ncbi:TPA: PepSY domain-containing protein [Methanosarcina acetivorans]|nr:PepSY domain-containing protein [Methanosarcina acetivorans]HIH95194.1 PepSY domain-containing protein [Methanosarcina acetivorans]